MHTLSTQSHAHHECENTKKKKLDCLVLQWAQSSDVTSQFTWSSSFTPTSYPLLHKLF